MTWTLHLFRSVFLALQLYFPSYKQSSSQNETVLVRELNRKKEQKRIQRRTYPLPRRRRVKSRLLPHEKNTKARDHRFSNQKALRRMYRNA